MTREEKRNGREPVQSKMLKMSRDLPNRKKKKKRKYIDNDLWKSKPESLICHMGTFQSFFFSFWYFHYTYVLPLVSPWIFYSGFVFFFFLTICFLCFSVFNDSIDIFPSSDILVFSHVQSTNKPIKGIVQFCYSGFIISSFFSPHFGSLLEFPSLCLYYPSVLACYLLY